MRTLRFRINVIRPFRLQSCSEISGLARRLSPLTRTIHRLSETTWHDIVIHRTIRLLSRIGLRSVACSFGT